jgi:hypothetical protein
MRTRSAYGILLDVACPAGVASPPHRRAHDSRLYLLAGRHTGALEGRDRHPADIQPGETLLHLAGVMRSIVALTESRWLEIKAPPETRWRDS